MEQPLKWECDGNCWDVQLNCCTKNSFCIHPIGDNFVFIDKYGDVLCIIILIANLRGFEMDDYTKELLIEHGIEENDIIKRVIKGDWEEAHLNGCDLKGFIFSRDANLKGAEFIGADLRNTKLAGHFELARFIGADMRGASFVCGFFNKAEFIGADLRGANIANSECYEANFRGADLRGACFGNEHHGSDFSSADLRGADYYKGDFDRCIMDGALITKANDE
jgi:hypothetical protein